MLLLFGRRLLAPTGNRSFPCLPQLLGQNIVLPLPNEGDEELEREGRGEGRKHFFIFTERTPEHVPFSFLKEGVALMMWGGSTVVNLPHLLPFILTLQPRL